MTQNRINDVATKIADQPEWIEDIYRSSSEYYFKYRGHTLSVVRRPHNSDWGQYSVYVYPHWDGATSLLANLCAAGDVGELEMVSYHGSDYGEDLFRRLYDTIEAKHLNIDEIFSDILSDF